eukprot:scaffold95_cov476-Prasinococcus_capsulatus_cf.AAC.4
MRALSLVVLVLSRVLEELPCLATSEHHKEHPNTLVGRVGALNAQKIVQNLTHTVYEWMLDAKATKWPSDTPSHVCKG